MNKEKFWIIQSIWFIHTILLKLKLNFNVPVKKIKKKFKLKPKWMNGWHLKLKMADCLVYMAELKNFKVNFEKPINKKKKLFKVDWSPIMLKSNINILKIIKVFHSHIQTKKKKFFFLKYFKNISHYHWSLWENI